MKLRIKGNTIRLRLTRPEVESLAASGAVEEQTHFGDGAVLRYRLVSDAAVAEPGAAFRDGQVTVRLPSAAVERWARETIVGLEHSTPLPGGGEMRVLVEKDFECLNPWHAEDEQGAYPNPDRGGACDHGAKD
jgi:hypothetical protein